MNNELIFFLIKTKDGSLWVAHEFTFEEFKELVDRDHAMMEFTEEKVRMAYVTVNNLCEVEKSTYCWIEFDKCGKVSHRWNIPFHYLTDGTSPEEHAGASLKFSSEYIWEPKGGDIQLVENAVKGHLMGLIDEAG